MDYVYVMTNEGFADKNEVKIGYTNDLDRRRKDLSGTSVSRPFTIAYSVCVHNARSLEQFVHHELKDFRINESREFFSCGVDLAIKTIDDLMTRYGITGVDGLKDFDYSTARHEQTDDIAYELGELAYERCGYSTDKKINFEARANNCTGGIAFSEFVRGWRDAEDYENSKNKQERAARAKESEIAAKAHALKEIAYKKFKEEAVSKNERKISGWGVIALLTLVALAATSGAPSLAAQLFFFGIFIVPGITFLFRTGGVPSMAEWERQEKKMQLATPPQGMHETNQLHTGVRLVEHHAGTSHSRSYTHAENALNVSRENQLAKETAKKTVHITSWDLPKSSGAPSVPYTPTKLEQYLLDQEAISDPSNKKAHKPT